MRNDRLKWLREMREARFEGKGEAVTKPISEDLRSLSKSINPQQPKVGRPKGKRQTKRRTGPAPEIEQQMAEAACNETIGSYETKQACS